MGSIFYRTPPLLLCSMHNASLLLIPIKSLVAIHAIFMHIITWGENPITILYAILAQCVENIPVIKHPSYYILKFLLKEITHPCHVQCGDEHRCETHSHWWWTINKLRPSDDLVMYICASKLGHHWFRYKCKAPNHYLNWCWPIADLPMLTHFIKNCSKIQQFSCTNCTWKLFDCDTTDIKEFQNVVCKWPPFCLSHNLLLFMRSGLHSGDVRDIWDALYMPNKMVRFLITCQEFLLLCPFMQPTNHTPFQAAMLEIELSWKQFFYVNWNFIICVASTHPRNWVEFLGSIVTPQMMKCDPKWK